MNPKCQSDLVHDFIVLFDFLKLNYSKLNLMKKAYNVYSILGKTVSKAAMVTSVFALCFLVFGTASAQTVAPAGPKSTTQSQQFASDYEQHIGQSVPYSALTDNLDRLDSDLVKNENAVSIAKQLFDNHNATANQASNASQEMEHELRSVFLKNFAGNLKRGEVFSSSFNAAATEMAQQFGAYDSSLYTGPTLNAIAESYLSNFF